MEEIYKMINLQNKNGKKYVALTFSRISNVFNGISIGVTKKVTDFLENLEFAKDLSRAVKGCQKCSILY